MKLIFAIFSLFALSCNTNSKVTKTPTEPDAGFTPVFASGPPVLVYKTKADFDSLVPVMLSDDKSEIVSYPHPDDLKSGNSYSVPSTLSGGYLLDNRGIGLNVAFLKFTYEEYAKLENIPSLKELYASIKEKDPLTELCNCGIKSAFTDVNSQVNSLIENKRLRTSCKVLK
ncbi:MAG: hypothetical protein EYC69_13635 [Bacteroidetes bacterium]|nr:MAG: hypothetical protein EYC69_13635 [Bacteroidota bacterium]